MVKPMNFCASLLVGLLVAAAATTAAAAGELDARDDRVIRITASSLGDAGFQQGALAASRIRGWFASDEMRALFAFALSDDAGSLGAKAFAALKRDNEAAFPEARDESGSRADRSSALRPPLSLTTRAATRYLPIDRRTGASSDHPPATRALGVHALSLSPSHRR